jgi:hypothetical protein
MQPCIECDAGSYSNIVGSTKCIQCPAGSYSNIIGSTNCIDCPAGSYSVLGSRSCINCYAGSYSLARSPTCIPCDTGYSSNIGSSSCNICDAGYSPILTSPLKCGICPAGKYSPPGASQCIDCPADTYSSNPGSKTCLSCPKGYYSETGSIGCTYRSGPDLHGSINRNSITTVSAIRMYVPNYTPISLQSESISNIIGMTPIIGGFNITSIYITYTSGSDIYSNYIALYYNTITNPLVQKYIYYEKVNLTHSILLDLDSNLLNCYRIELDIKCDISQTINFMLYNNDYIYGFSITGTFYNKIHLDLS